MLYCRDQETGEHLVTHHGHERRFRTRAEAMAEARRIAAEKSDDADD